MIQTGATMKWSTSTGDSLRLQRQYLREHQSEKSVENHSGATAKHKKPQVAAVSKDFHVTFSMCTVGPTLED